MIALTTSKTAVQPHSRVQSRALSTMDMPDGADSSSFDITDPAFRACCSPHASTTPRGAPDTGGAQAGAARNPLPGMATGRYFPRMTRTGDAMANDDEPARVRVPVREERRGFWGEWGWMIVSEVVRAILRGIFYRG